MPVGRAVSPNVPTPSSRSPFSLPRSLRSRETIGRFETDLRPPSRDVCTLGTCCGRDAPLRWPIRRGRTAALRGSCPRRIVDLAKTNPQRTAAGEVVGRRIERGRSRGELAVDEELQMITAADGRQVMPAGTEVAIVRHAATRLHAPHRAAEIARRVEPRTGATPQARELLALKRGQAGHARPFVGVLEFVAGRIEETAHRRPSRAARFGRRGGSSHATLRLGFRWSNLDHGRQAQPSGRSETLRPAGSCRRRAGRCRRTAR